MTADCQPRVSNRFASKRQLVCGPVLLLTACAFAASALPALGSPVQAASTQALPSQSGTTAETPSPASALATRPPLTSVNVEELRVGEVLHLTVGHTLLLECQTALKKVYVGSPSVLHTFAQGSREVLVTAKTAGMSSLVLWRADGVRYVLTVQSDLDVESLRKALASAFPGEKIEVASDQDKLVLAGSLASSANKDAAYKLALEYSKNVVDTMSVAVLHPKQVQLKLRIVEVDRTKLAQYGFNFFSQGSNTSGSTTQQFGSVGYSANPGSSGGSVITFSDPLNFLFYNSATNLGASVKDLEQKDILQVLAEPTLTTISGLPAKFLSGGEFPVPVVQGGTGNSTAITIVYRPYGVKVDFMPTVNEDGTIRLKVSPEVSTLDYSNAVTISGFTIPALSTRRAETEVEIKDGESFVVSGLLDRRATDSLSHMPGIASIPILGDLFKSKSINHSVVELLVVVTASVVDPLTKPDEINEPKPIVPFLDKTHFDKAINPRGVASPSGEAGERP